jgi:RNA polymerase sigma-70 factor (ECF subfamily)
MSAPPSVEIQRDTELLMRIAAKDRTAFVALFERYAGRIKSFAMRGGASPADAEEVAQDAMVTVWRRAEQYDPARAAPSTWIYAIARNRRIDMMRRSRRPAPDPEDPLFQPDAEPSGISQLSALEREETLREGLAALVPEQRQVLMATFFDGLSHGEAAERLGLPLGTVKSRIRLAFGHLRGLIDAEVLTELSDE